jgi:L-2,4-diaminobutyrate decarboxylase
MPAPLHRAYDPDEFRKSAHQIVDFLADQLEASLAGQQAQVLPWIKPQQAFEEVGTWISRSPETEPQTEFQLLELFEQVYSRCIRLHHPNYLGHQISPPLPVAALAGLMSDLLNNGMGVFEMGIAGTAIERYVIKSVAAKFGMDEQADGVLTSGGTLGNLTALLAARRVKAQCDVWQQGTERPLAILVSDQAHYCMDRAVRIMGWGEQGLVRVPTDAQFRMRVDLLDECVDEAVRRGRQVIAVVGSACSTATGSFDDLTSIGNFCRQHDLWFHVDGAHGAAAAYSEKYRGLVQGIELADSVTLDFHKLLMTPALATAIIYRNGQHGKETFSQRAEYLWSENTSAEVNPDDDWHDLARRTFECTKTMTGLKIFSIMAAHGTEIFSANVTKLFDLAKEFADLIEAAPDFELAIHPQSNIV